MKESMYELFVCYIIKHSVYFLLSLSRFPLLRYVCLDKCIRSFLSLSFFLLSLFIVRRRLQQQGENTAADGQHAFASVHSLKRGGTYARSVHNDRTKGTQKKTSDVNLRHTYKKRRRRRNDENLAQTGNDSAHSLPGR